MSYWNTDDLPLNFNFFRPLKKYQKKRMVKLGFDIKTMSFEVPYLFRSGVSGGITRDYRNKLYYKTFYSTEGVIDGLSDSELEVVIFHENDEIEQTLNEFKSDEFKNSFVTVESEQERHVDEIKLMESKFGKAIVHNCLLKTQQISSLKPALSRTISAYWLYQYVLANYESLLPISYKMPESMITGTQVTKYINVIEAAKKEYDGKLPNSEFDKLIAEAVILVNPQICK